MRNRHFHAIRRHRFFPGHPRRQSLYAGLRRAAGKLSPARKLPFALIALGAACILLLLSWSHGSSPPPRFKVPTRMDPLSGRPDPASPPPNLSSDFPGILLLALQSLDGASCLEVQPEPDRLYSLQTTLNTSFQREAFAALKQSRVLGGTVVALEPLSGRVLALAVFNQDESAPVAFYWKAYPAASLFKIVTATAALDRGLLEPASLLSYNGAPYLLTKKNLSDKTYSWSETVPLAEAFARSLNPVFGKIGIYLLGKKALEEYGSAFYFNRPAPSEIPFETGRLQVPDDAFGIAEIASGFNRKTTLSPVQAAWIAAALFSDGAAPAPWIVQTLSLAPGETLYVRSGQPAIRFLPPETAKKLKLCMEETIRTGTCRNAFAPAQRLSHLRAVRFGGKTGNINNDEGTIKYDWFAGYGENQETGQAVALCVMLLHGQALGTRANRVAFELFSRYFQISGEP
jgi:peptidoglycan glycosyltransferase